MPTKIEISACGSTPGLPFGGYHWAIYSDGPKAVVFAASKQPSFERYTAMEEATIACAKLKLKDAKIIGTPSYDHWKAEGAFARLNEKNSNWYRLRTSMPNLLMVDGIPSDETPAKYQRDERSPTLVLVRPTNTSSGWYSIHQGKDFVVPCFDPPANAERERMEIVELLNGAACVGHTIMDDLSILSLNRLCKIIEDKELTVDSLVVNPNLIPVLADLGGTPAKLKWPSDDKFTFDFLPAIDFVSCPELSDNIVIASAPPDFVGCYAMMPSGETGAAIVNDYAIAKLFIQQKKHPNETQGYPVTDMVVTVVT